MSDYPILDSLTLPEDLKRLREEQIEPLCAEIRSFLIENVAKTGGHLASNLGVVELSVALELEFDSSRDRIVYDVGHQSYVHKLLTGRREGFSRLRQLGGMSGFPRPAESCHDAFVAGHASTSVSVAAGMARARTLLGEDYGVVAVIGDGALSGGMAYEALNDVGRSGEPLIVILNDNNMSISPSVGALAQRLSRVRLRRSYTTAKRRVKAALDRLPGGDGLYRYIHSFKQKLRKLLLPGAFFENMGFVYIGPGNGHDVGDIRELIRYAKLQHRPVLIHLKTVKGNGYRFSQEKPETFHGIQSFNTATGKPVSSHNLTFSDVFGSELCSLAAAEPRLVAITAAMADGTGLVEFSKRYPSRFIDVGIAEEHAVTMAAGMAKQGLVPVCAIYSTFLQRAFDQLIHDVALSSLHVVFAVDRAGITGEDGATHQGLFDAAFLAEIPGLTILCPVNEHELRACLRRAVLELRGPVAVRYPRGGASAFHEDTGGEAAVYLRRDPGAVITLSTYGTLIDNVREAGDRLAALGLPCEVIKLNMIKPLPLEVYEESTARTGRLLFCEDCVSEGSVGQRIAAGLYGVQLRLVNAGDAFLQQGSISELRRLLGLDTESLISAACELIRGDGAGTERKNVV